MKPLYVGYDQGGEAQLSKHKQDLCVRDIRAEL